MAFGISPDKLAISPAEILADIALRRKLRLDKSRGSGRFYTGPIRHIGKKRGTLTHYGVGGKVKSSINTNEYENIHYGVGGRIKSATMRPEVKAAREAQKSALDLYRTKQAMDLETYINKLLARKKIFETNDRQQQTSRPLTKNERVALQVADFIRSGEYDRYIRANDLGKLATAVYETYKIPLTYDAIQNAIKERMAIYEKPIEQATQKPNLPAKERPPVGSAFIKMNGKVYSKNFTPETSSSDKIIVVHPVNGQRYMYIPGKGYVKID